MEVKQPADVVAKAGAPAVSKVENDYRQKCLNNDDELNAAMRKANMKGTEGSVEATRLWFTHKCKAKTKANACIALKAAFAGTVHAYAKPADGHLEQVKKKGKASTAYEFVHKNHDPVLFQLAHDSIVERVISTSNFLQCVKYYNIDVASSVDEVLVEQFSGMKKAEVCPEPIMLETLVRMAEEQIRKCTTLDHIADHTGLKELKVCEALLKEIQIAKKKAGEIIVTLPTSKKTVLQKQKAMKKAVMKKKKGKTTNVANEDPEGEYSEQEDDSAVMDISSEESIVQVVEKSDLEIAQQTEIVGYSTGATNASGEVTKSERLEKPDEDWANKPALENPYFVFIERVKKFIMANTQEGIKKAEEEKLARRERKKEQKRIAKYEAKMHVNRMQNMTPPLPRIFRNTIFRSPYFGQSPNFPYFMPPVPSEEEVKTDEKLEPCVVQTPKQDGPVNQVTPKNASPIHTPMMQEVVLPKVLVAPTVKVISKASAALEEGPVPAVVSPCVTEKVEEPEDAMDVDLGEVPVAVQQDGPGKEAETIVILPLGSNRFLNQPTGEDETNHKEEESAASKCLHIDDDGQVMLITV